MMGASVYPAKEQTYLGRSYEYLHKPKRLGGLEGVFKRECFPSGEFAYKDLNLAYPYGDAVKSTLNRYYDNTYFCPSMTNLKAEYTKQVYDFDVFSESSSDPLASSIAPYIALEWEKLGRQCAYAHIAKGGVSINHYFTMEMIDDLNRRIREHNQKFGTSLEIQALAESSIGASEYFSTKTRDFFEDSARKFEGENLDNKCLVWLQGECDSTMPKNLYRLYLDTLWDWLKRLGFTHFFVIRVGYWMQDEIVNIMRAQEEFCEQTSDAYMLTRICSYMPMTVQNLDAWYDGEDVGEYTYCRDSYYGYDNQHINDKGNQMIAKSATANIYRVLVDHLDVSLESEKCTPLKQ